MRELEDLSIAVCHGNYMVTGGDYKVAEKIAETLDATMYIGFMNEELETSDKIETNVLFDTYFSKLISNSRLTRDLFSMDWWEHVGELDDYDIIIQSGNEPGWYVPQDEQTIVKYCHAPPRTPYENFHEKGDSFINRLYSRVVRKTYLPYVNFPTRIIVPSELVEKRVKKYWNRDSEVLYPPVVIDEYNCQSDRGVFYLAFSRLHPDKRIYEIAEQFSNTDKQLVIGGSGKQRKKIEKISRNNSNIDYRGFLSDFEKKSLLSRCKALIFNPVDEAFGIVPVEAMASGAPVIGVKDGYTKYQIKDGYNGISYDRGQILYGVKRFEENGIDLSSSELRQHSKRYSLKNFQRGIRKITEEAWKEDQIELDF